jgi:hypothetical protein
MPSGGKALITFLLACWSGFRPAQSDDELVTDDETTDARAAGFEYDVILAMASGGTSEASAIPSERGRES